MSVQRQVLFWFIGIAIFVAILVLLNAVLLPFVAGMAIAYFLDPLADRLERAGLGRMTAVSIIVGLFALVFVLALLVIVPVLGRQIAAFAANLPGYIEALQAIAKDAGPDWLREFLSGASEGRDETFRNLAGKAAEWIGSLVSSVVSGGAAIVSILSLLVVTPVVAFYMLYDWDRMVSNIDSYFPRQHATALRSIAREIDEVLAGFVRGQGTVCLLLGAFYAIALTLAGLNFGLLIGVAAGLLSFIPYVGSIVGLLLSGGVALAQFWPDWVQVGIIFAIFAVGQVIEGNFLSPKLVGGSVRLHPVWLIFALFAFGNLFGFVGMLIAVPVAAAIGVLVRFGLAQYLLSPLYRGPPRPRARKGGRARGKDR